MRQKIVAGNWKCNTTLQEGIELAKAVDAVVAKEKATTRSETSTLTACLNHFTEPEMIQSIQRIRNWAALRPEIIRTLSYGDMLRGDGRAAEAAEQAKAEAKAEAEAVEPIGRGQHRRRGVRTSP